MKDSTKIILATLIALLFYTQYKILGFEITLFTALAIIITNQFNQEK